MKTDGLTIYLRKVRPKLTCKHSARKRLEEHLLAEIQERSENTPSYEDLCTLYGEPAECAAQLLETLPPSEMSSPFRPLITTLIVILLVGFCIFLYVMIDAFIHTRLDYSGSIEIEIHTLAPGETFEWERTTETSLP